MRKFIAMMLTMLVLATTLARAEPRFRVCADPANPPLSTRVQDGFENKIARLLARKSGQEVEYVWFPQRIGFLRNTLKKKDASTGRYLCDVVMGVPAGYELAATTKPYYRSTYVLVVAKGRGFDDIRRPEQLFGLPESRKRRLQIAMFDRTPGVTWLLRHGLLEQGRTYQSMTGDPSVNTAIRLEKEFDAGHVNMAIVWGPIGAYLAWKHPRDYDLIPLKSEKGIRFDYAISMAVRRGDEERLRQLQRLIDANRDEILAVLREYRVPLVDREGNSL